MSAARVIRCWTRFIDGDYETRWATDGGLRAAWIAVEYDTPRQVSSLQMCEGWDRIRAFELQCRDGSGWKTIFKGTTVGENFKCRFDPVTYAAGRNSS